MEISTYSVKEGIHIVKLIFNERFLFGTKKTFNKKKANHEKREICAKNNS